MNSVATKRFWDCFAALEDRVQQQALTAYRLWRDNPSHRSLDFKQVHTRRPIVAVRIGLHWRALGVREGGTVIWFWIGSHADYDKLLTRL
jgi:putative hemolysin